MAGAVTAQQASRFARFGAGLRAALRVGLDVALPPLCPACREPVRDTALCPACWSKLSFIAPPYCERLGIPFAYDPGPGMLSMEAIADPPAYGRARAAVRYDDVARALVHALKYGDRLDLAPTMGRWAGERRARTAGRGRRARSGAAALAPALGAPVQPVGAARRGDLRPRAAFPSPTDALRRVKATAQQVGLSRAQRADNVQGAFRVAADARAEVAGRRLVLVDDVLTSGATIDACARTLLRAGARNVDVLGVRAGCGRGAHAHIVRHVGMAHLSCIFRATRCAPRVEIYTTPFCPYCSWAKELLHRKGVAFTEIDVAGQPASGAPR